MNKPVRLLPDARTEFDEATDWYEQQSAGQGIRFVAAVREALERIASHPDRYALIHRSVRKALVRGYPYLILYRDEPETILVIAVFHTSRNPAVWKSRT